MTLNVKPFLIAGFGLITSAWWFGLHNTSSMDEVAYSREECAQDLCKIHTDLAVAAESRKDLATAITFYTSAITNQPSCLRTYDKLGSCYEKTENIAKALATYFHGLAINPNIIEDRFSPGTIPFESAEREKLKGLRPWQGENLQDKIIYVLAEKGLGDTINFARFIPVLQEKGARVLFKVQKDLVSLIKRSFENIEIIEPTVDPRTLVFDYYSPLLSLPHLLDATPELVKKSYRPLRADAALTEIYRTQLFATKKLKVGIFWQGDKKHINDHNRSVPLQYFYDLGRLPDVQLYSLQMFAGIEQLQTVPSDISIIDLQEFMADLDGKAALIKHCDLVITVDSMVAHLAASLDIPTYMLTPHVTDWRWLYIAQPGQETIWYPQLHKLRQPKPGKWKPVFTQLKNIVTLHQKKRSV
jgi:tetratricopeptide (TPR) repeat protein